MDTKLILYVGELAAGEALATAAEANGHYVYLPHTTMQALGMYITYMPHVIVIDMETANAQEVYEHLRSVDAQPMVLLSEERLRLAIIHTLPRTAAPEAIIDYIERLGQPNREPNGVLRYA